MTKKARRRYRDRILTDLYHSGKIQEKVDRMCFRNHIKPETFISEDILQETFLHLSRQKDDLIIELHEDDMERNDGKSRLVGLAVRIAVWKGVSHCSKDRNYPKHSLKTLILFASNLQSLNSLNVTECFNVDEINGMNILVDESTEETTDVDVWEQINKFLSDEELEFIHSHNGQQKYRPKRNRENREKYEQILHRVDQIMTDQKIEIYMTQETKFDNVKKLLTILTEWKTKGTVKVNPEQKLLLKNTYQAIHPGVQMNLNCDSCISNYLNMLCAWYEREYPKYQTTLEPVIELEEIKVPEIKPKVKRTVKAKAK